MKQKKPNLGKNLDEFIQHLSFGIDAAGIDFEELNPMYVIDKKTNEKGFMFAQIQRDIDSMVVAFNDRVEFNNGSSLVISKSQPKVAILFIVSIIQKNPINAPICSECKKEEVLV